MQMLKPVRDSADHGDRPFLVFAHANGYPPEAYRALLEPLCDDFAVFTVEHRPFWSAEPPPTYLSWQHYAHDLIGTIEGAARGPAIMVGHSMGGVVSLLLCLARPELCSRMVLIDPVLVPYGFWFANQVLMRCFGRDLHMVTKAQNRPHNFESYQSAFDFYRSKRPFRGISDDVLWDYVRAGHAQDGTEGWVSLRWQGAWEACVYRSAPSVIRSLRKIHQPTCGIVGENSAVMGPVARARWRQAMPNVELNTLEGGHLIPLEQPQACANLIQKFLLASD